MPDRPLRNNRRPLEPIPRQVIAPEIQTRRRHDRIDLSSTTDRTKPAVDWLTGEMWLWLRGHDRSDIARNHDRRHNTGIHPAFQDRDKLSDPRLPSADASRSTGPLRQIL